MGVLGPHHDGRSRSVAHTGAVEDTQRAGDQRRVADNVLGHLLAELRPGVLRAVDVVLPGDTGQDILHLVGVHAVLLGVGRREQAEVRRRGGVRAGPVGRRGGADQAGEPGVLELFHPDRHGDVVGAAGHRVAGVAQRLRAGGAVVLQPGDRLVGQPQRTRERQPGVARTHRAEPVGVDVVPGEPRRGVGCLGGLDQQVVDGGVPAFPERRAAHADDGNLVPDPA